MKIRFFCRVALFGLSIILFFNCGRDYESEVKITGTLMQWHKITMTIAGPETSESDTVNPFLDYRLNVLFYKDNKEFNVPGFYAADGNSAETSANSGNKWKVVFRPNDYGLWNYRVSFREGENIAVSDEPEAGTPLPADKLNGEFFVKPSDKSGRDFRASGRVRYADGHYLEYEGTGGFFLKAGADSPENFLAYQDFDNTYYGGDDRRREGEAAPNRDLHLYEPHVRDWNEGDPTWQGAKGKGIIGALNYLASRGMNSVYMLTNNVGGDGKDVFPWIEYESDFTRFDVSKLAQWGIVFSHMDSLGLMCHFVTQETENELMLDSGNLGLHRKLYYRELIARFSHHLGITWNLGEENGVVPWLGYGQNDQQRKDMAKFFKLHDPYKNFVVVHTIPNPEIRQDMLGKLLGFPYLDGPSLQTHVGDVHEVTVKWRKESAEQGKPWVVCSDEIGPASTGALPDEVDPEHNTIRKKVLWGNLMGGGGGVEWYFGYDYPCNDLNCEDWRTREELWKQTRTAVKFFQDHLPFSRMQPADHLVSPRSNYAFVLGDELLVVYIPNGGASTVKLNPAKTYSIEWFDPKNGGEIFKVDTTTYTGMEDLNFRLQNRDTSQDWVAILRSVD